MMKNKKALSVFGLLAVAVILVVGLLTVLQPDKQPDNVPDTDMLISNVTPNEIGDVSPVTTAPSIQPSAIPTITPSEDGKNGNDIPLTDIADKPEAPELPDTAYTGEPTDDATIEDVEAHEALDPALKNPDKKPTTTPAPVEPSKPKDTTPQSGDKNGNGEVYIPGFGWVKDEGGGGQGSDSYVDESKLDNIIGH